MELVAALDHRSVLADFHHRDTGHFGHRLQRLARRAVREGRRLRLVGEDDVDVVLDNVLQEHNVGFHDIVGRHVQRNDHAALLPHLHRAAHQILVLDQIALDVQIIVALKIRRLQIVGFQLQGCAQIGRKRTVGIGRGDEDHRPAGSRRAHQQVRLDAVLHLRLAEERAQLVVPHLADIARGHSQDGRRRNRVGGRTARDILHPDLLEIGPDGIAGGGIHVLHAAQRQIVFLEKRIVGKDRQNVGQRIPDTENRFLHTVFVFSFLR